MERRASRPSGLGWPGEDARRSTGNVSRGKVMTNDLLKEAYGAMQHNRRRTTLTMLGMAWGIATVVILLAFGSGFERAINMIFSSWGTDVIGAFPGRTSLQAGGAKAVSEVRLKLADVDYVRNEVPMVKGVTPIFDRRGEAKTVLWRTASGAKHPDQRRELSGDRRLPAQGAGRRRQRQQHGGDPFQRDGRSLRHAVHHRHFHGLRRAGSSATGARGSERACWAP